MLLKLSYLHSPQGLAAPVSVPVDLVKSRRVRLRFCPGLASSIQGEETDPHPVVAATSLDKYPSLDTSFRKVDDRHSSLVAFATEKSKEFVDEVISKQYNIK